MGTLRVQRTGPAEWLFTPTSGQIQLCGRHTNWNWLNRNNSGADCLIMLKFKKVILYCTNDKHTCVTA